jgi:hypothetical protein
VDLQAFKEKGNGVSPLCCFKATEGTDPILFPCTIHMVQMVAFTNLSKTPPKCGGISDLYHPSEFTA